MKKINWKLCLILLAVSISSLNSQELGIQITGGIVSYPMHDWKEFYGQTDNHDVFYTRKGSHLFSGLNVKYGVTKNHYLMLGTEQIETSAHFGPNPTASPNALSVDWKFSAIPITVGYEYHLNSYGDKFIPIFGLGISYLWSKLTARYVDLTEVPDGEGAALQYGYRTGRGYAAQASIGFQARVSQRINLSYLFRRKLSDGMSFSDKKTDIPVRFDGYDFSVGAEFILKK